MEYEFFRIEEVINVIIKIFNFLILGSERVKNVLLWCIFVVV